MATVLIVDDNPDERRIVATTLYYNGFDTLEAGRGADGISAARESLPDLILLDIKLPDMSGLLVAEIIRAHPDLRPIPVVCITGLDITQETVRAKGCVDLLIKPVLPHELVAAVHRNLAAPPATATSIPQRFSPPAPVHPCSPPGPGGGGATCGV
ncbi:MAG: response regulator [Gemmatimonadota bacterium]